MESKPNDWPSRLNRRDDLGLPLSSPVTRKYRLSRPRPAQRALGSGTRARAGPASLVGPAEHTAADRGPPLPTPAWRPTSRRWAEQPGGALLLEVGEEGQHVGSHGPARASGVGRPGARASRQDQDPARSGAGAPQPGMRRDPARRLPRPAAWRRGPSRGGADPTAPWRLRPRRRRARRQAARGSARIWASRRPPTTPTVRGLRGKGGRTTGWLGLGRGPNDAGRRAGGEVPHGLPHRCRGVMLEPPLMMPLPPATPTEG